jgi:hypothetical protein
MKNPGGMDGIIPLDYLFKNNTKANANKGILKR